MANKKKRSKKKHQGMKKPSSKPEVLSKQEKDKVLRGVDVHTKKQPNVNLNHKAHDDQHKR